MKNKEALENGNMWQLMATMTIPCILAQIVNLLYNIVDRMYIGNMEGIGKTALAGLGLCIPIITLISAFSSFISSGGAPLASRALGAEDNEKALKVLGNGAFLLLFFSFTLGIIAYCVKKPVLYLIGASDKTFIYANDYLSIYLLGTIFVQISVGLNTFLTAQGKSKSAMISTLIGAVINISLDPLFIFVFKMGIKGAALATVIAQCISAIWVLSVLLNKNTTLRLIPSYMKPDIKIIGAILELGIAGFVMSATESVIGFALNGRLEYYGGDNHVSNLAILQSCMMLISTPISGFTQGVTPILSYNFGAKNKIRLKECYKKTLLVAFLYCSIFALVMIIFPYPFVRMFAKDAELIELAVKTLPIFVCGMLIFGIQRACQTTFVAMGEAIISLFIAVLRKLILLVPFAYLFPLFMGVNGVYVAECTADIISAVTCGTIFFFRFKKILKSLPDEVKDKEAIC